MTGALRGGEENERIYLIPRDETALLYYLFIRRKRKGERRGAGDFISNEGPGTQEGALEILRRCIIGRTEFEMQSKCNRMSTLTY